MAIPTALGKLGDTRAISLLAKIIESASVSKDDDSDSSDDPLFSGGKDRLAIECCFALASFIGQFL